MNKTIKGMIVGALSLMFTGGAFAAPILLDSSTQCSAGNANLISVGDVTGDAGGSTDCWGAYAGNDPGPSGDGLQIGADIFEFVSKYEFDDAGAPITEGASMGLFADIDASSGEWSFDADSMIGDFIIVLKAANSPGWGAWLFSGDDNDSHSGDFTIAWGQGLSHIAVYGELNPVPLPASGILLVGAVGGLAALRRRKK